MQEEGDVNLKSPVRQPANNVDWNDGQHQAGDPTVGLFLLLGLLCRPDLAQSQHHEDIEDADERHWDGKAQDEAVPDEGFVGRDRLALRPDDGAGVPLLRSVELQNSVRVQYYREHDTEGHGPDAETKEQCDACGSVLHGADRMTHGQVAVSAHDRQREDTSEQVDGEEDEVDLAHGEAEHPVLEDAGGRQEGKADDEERVRDGEVEDVHVGDSLHLGVAQDHVDDETVAQPAEEEDKNVADGAEPSQGFLHRFEARERKVAGVGG